MVNVFAVRDDDGAIQDPGCGQIVEPQVDAETQAFEFWNDDWIWMVVEG